MASNTLEKTAIQKTSGVNGGDACVRDTRITVWALIQLQKLGRTEEQLLADFPSLAPADIDAVWNYYRAHPREIDLAIATQERESRSGWRAFIRMKTSRSPSS
jgi:uncharacterized protein (DUF433 family)